MPNKEPSSYYFELQATWGLTKHMGGLEGTRELVEACHIDKDSYVLDVGSGVGITPCYLAREYGCRVAGVDLSEQMVERARERAKKRKVEERVEFFVGDARDLPFPDGTFDAVISESVVAFPKEKQQVINEYTRVAKPGGYVGINEVTWIETPPAELVDYMTLAMGDVEFLTADGWKSLLVNAGLQDVIASPHSTTAIRQWTEEIKQMSPGDYLSAWAKFIPLIFKSPGVRQWMRRIMFPPRIIFKIFKYFGYGIYAGRK